MMSFESLRPYGFIHHRALNGRPALQEAIADAKKYPTRRHVFEGDVCWDFSPGRQDLYFRHPSFVVDTLAPPVLDENRANKNLIFIGDLAEIDGDVFFVIELKVGRGDWRAAMARLIRFMDEHHKDRYWIDGFSLKLLDHVKNAYPHVRTTLHTECVFNGHAVVGAPEWPPMQIRQIKSLSVDGVAVRWRLGDEFMAHAARDVIKSGKALLVSRIHSLKQFRLSRQWGAIGGYVHGDFAELMREEDQILKTSLTHAVNAT